MLFMFFEKVKKKAVLPEHPSFTRKKTVLFLWIKKGKDFLHFSSISFSLFSITNF